LSGERVERRLAAILAADVAGYSRLMGDDEEGTLARLKSIRKTLVDPAIASHRGRIVKTTGDGMLVEFASAVDAVRSAVEVQRSMAEQNAAVPQDQRIEFRIGIHVGDIIIDENDIFGDGVNIAARLEGISEPGGVCISDDAQRQIRAKVDIAFDDMGPQTLKNIAEPMRAWRVRVGTSSALGPSHECFCLVEPKPRAPRQAVHRGSAFPEHER
jgi:adenylate cyclase